MNTQAYIHTQTHKRTGQATNAYTHTYMFLTCAGRIPRICDEAYGKPAQKHHIYSHSHIHTYIHTCLICAGRVQPRALLVWQLWIHAHIHIHTHICNGGVLRICDEAYGKPAKEPCWYGSSEYMHIYRHTQIHT
jgi:hypothetical protein